MNCAALQISPECELAAEPEPEPEPERERPPSAEPEPERERKPEPEPKRECVPDPDPDPEPDADMDVAPLLLLASALSCVSLLLFAFVLEPGRSQLSTISLACALCPSFLVDVSSLAPPEAEAPLASVATSTPGAA